MTALRNYTEAVKYENKTQKALGITIYRKTEDLDSIETAWLYLDEDWTFNADIAQLLEDNYPFRTSHNKATENHYK